MAHVHRTRRVGRDELDDDPLTGCHTPATEALPRRQQLAQRSAVPGVGQEQVQEAGARDLEALQLLTQTLVQQLAEMLCQLARLRAHGRREQQGGIRGVVAEIRTWRALERDRSMRARAAGLLAGEGEHGLA